MKNKIINYLWIGSFHLYLAFPSTILVFLIIIFESVRITAVLNRSFKILILLGIASYIFICSNYYSKFEANKKISDGSEKIIENTSNYASKYWVSAKDYKELIKLQNKAQRSLEKKSMPNPIFIYIIMALLEIASFFLAIGKVKGNRKQEFVYNGTLYKKKPKAKINPKTGRKNAIYLKGDKEITAEHFGKVSIRAREKNES